VTEKIPVSAEWALQGKTLGRAGARVLACSTGTLSMENFTELIGRFSLGTPDELPQVSVSYLTSGTHPGRVYYLGMAIHRWAPDVQTDGGELLARDDDKRPVATTTYFCIPYQPPADITLSYKTMYQEFNGISLSLTSAPPLQVEFPPERTCLEAVSLLAMQSASRLISGRPVCVLGGESTTVAERLAFIDAVTQLLPYGLRTRLAAATWVRPTHRDHRFRLFFSAEKRDAKPPDDFVYWGQPEATALTPQDDYAYMYYQWLVGTVGQLEVLARLTTPRSFSREDILQSLDDIGIRLPASDEETQDHEQKAPAATRKPRFRRIGLDVDQILHNCAASLQTSNVPELNTAVTRLKASAKSIIPADRPSYQEIIREEHLFRHSEALGGIQTKLRDALFKVAFPAPLSYKDYCLIEDSCLGAASPGTESPDGELLRMIAGTAMADLRIRVVVYGQLPTAETRRLLDGWYRSFQMTAVELINTAAAAGWHRPVHALHASVIAADLMSHVACDPDLTRRVLRSQGYLSRLLQTAGDGHDNTQVYVLSWFLKTAYPDGLREDAVRSILIGREDPPSPALLAAVLLQITPGNTHVAELAREAYVFSTVKAMHVEAKTHSSLEQRLPFADGWPADRAREQNPYPATGQP
jgi:hypothetical protein